MCTCIVHTVFASRLSGEVVESHSLEISKKKPRYNSVLLAVGGPASAGRLDKMTCRTPFQLQPLCDDSVSH